ncbi:MAG: tetratricopeptide repeat protein [Blastochloris sp.]|nr:tetratricopeptide repeat protein [Blastochloris sp.]
MSFQQQINAAIGYFNLGMIDDALAELNDLSPVDAMRPETIALRVSVQMRKGLWDKALEGSELLCALLPDHPSPYLDAAFCLHELSRTEEARSKLLSGPTNLKSSSLFYYNMACYEAQLNLLESARVNLEQAISMSQEIQDSWESDPDLQALRGT